MKAITLTQPWATLMAIGAKRIETRTWPTEYRGHVAIHAAKGFPDDARYIVGQEPFQSTLAAALGKTLGVPLLATALPTACVIAVGNLVECFRFDDDTIGHIRTRSARGRLPAHEADFGDYAAGRYGFVFEDIVALEEHVPARGMLNLWNMPSDVERAVNIQLAALAA